MSHRLNPATRPPERKAIMRLVESSGELSSRMIAEALGVSNHTVDTVRGQLGKSPAGKRTGKDGKQYPAKMKREKRTADDAPRWPPREFALMWH